MVWGFGACVCVHACLRACLCVLLCTRLFFCQLVCLGLCIDIYVCLCVLRYLRQTRTSGMCTLRTFWSHFDWKRQPQNPMHKYFVCICLYRSWPSRWLFEYLTLCCMSVFACGWKRVCSLWYNVNKSIAITISETINAGFFTHTHAHTLTVFLFVYNTFCFPFCWTFIFSSEATLVSFYRLLYAFLTSHTLAALSFGLPLSSSGSLHLLPLHVKLWTDLIHISLVVGSFKTCFIINSYCVCCLPLSTDG